MEGSPRAPSLGGESDEYVAWDAAYVLGSLSDADRGEYEAHLRDCRSCRESVDELRGMPALLGQLTADEVAAIDDGASETLPPLSGQILTSLLAKVSRRRRVARVATWTMAAAAAVMVFGVLAGVQFHWGPTASVPRADASALAMTPVAPTELTATVAMTGHLGNPNRHELHLPGGTGHRRPSRGRTPPASSQWWWSAATAATTDWPPGWRSTVSAQLRPEARQCRSTKSPQ